MMRGAGRNENRSQKLNKFIDLGRFAGVQESQLDCAAVGKFRRLMTLGLQLFLRRVRWQMLHVVNLFSYQPLRLLAFSHNHRARHGRMIYRSSKKATQWRAL
jgi:hypothetical protein